MAETNGLREWLDQCDHERMKSFMEMHGWSISICANPADLYEIRILEEEDSDTYPLSHKQEQHK